MKKKLITLCEHIFGIFLMVSVLIGAVVAALFLIAFAAGGNAGQSLAIFGKNVMYAAIGIAAIGSIIGMLAFYIDDSHVLKIDSNEDSASVAAGGESKAAVNN